MADHWEYRIESYSRIPGESGLTPATADKAQAWLGFREKGDDRRCFGAFPSRAEADKAMRILQERDQQPQPATAEQPVQGYHLDYRRNGTEDEFIICAPDGRHMAYIRFWDEGWDGPGAGDKEAKADSRLIVDALNAYAAGRTRSEATARDGTANVYHATPGPDDFGADAIEIRAPDGRSMAFSVLSDQPEQAKADAQLIADALNAYQPHLAQEQPDRSAARQPDTDRKGIAGDRAAGSSTESQETNEQRRLEGFHALLADYKNSSHYLEDMDGRHRQWRDMSTAGKLGYVLLHAAADGVPFERFAEAARDVLRDQPPAVREEAALRVLFANQRDLRETAKAVIDLAARNQHIEPRPHESARVPTASTEQTEKVYAIEQVKDGRWVVWNTRDMEPEDIFSDEAMARDCATTLNSQLHKQQQQPSKGKHHFANAGTPITEAPARGAGELAASLFGNGAAAHKEIPELQKESPPHDRDGRRR